MNSSNLPLEGFLRSATSFISSKLINSSLSFLSEAQNAFKKSKSDFPKSKKLFFKIIFISSSFFSGKHFFKFHLEISLLSSRVLKKICPRKFPKENLTLLGSIFNVFNKAYIRNSNIFINLF